MRVLGGIAAAPGAAIGAPWIYRLPSSGEDRLDLAEATKAAEAELVALADRLRHAGRSEDAGILDAQALMAHDPELIGGARRRMKDGAAASEAILAEGEAQASTLSALDNELLASRAVDVRDVAQRIARAIRGNKVPRLERPSIAVAADLPPSVTVELDPELLLGIALEAGSATAHAAILARALGIPAVVGVAGLLDVASDANSLGVDGTGGAVTIDPDGAARERLAAVLAAQRELRAADAQLRATPLATRDGHRITLLANIGRPEEAPLASAAGAEGIGLFRTEFMFMGRSSAPTVAAQAEAYAAALAPFAGRPVVIRTLDVGGDKQLPYLAQEPEGNPFLGLRAIRLAEHNREVLVAQLRAILKAAARSKAETWIMAPMVADLGDVALVRALLAEAAVDPEDSAPRLKVGIMVELPAAAIVADQLAGAVDFFSIGTNDLTQYLLAADRTNPSLALRQDPMHPAVLRSIRAVVEAGHAAHIPVAVCGEMAGDPVGAVTLAGLGVDELSMDPGSFGSVKRALDAVTQVEAERVAARACDARSAADARRMVADIALGLAAGGEFA